MLNNDIRTSVEIIGTGVHAPGEPIDNTELKSLAKIEFDADKIEAKLGIKKRHIAKLRGIEETTADFATKASLDAIKNAKIDPNEVDLFIIGTDTPEYISPATALIVQGRIQAKEKFALSFDIAASCASFTTAFDTAVRIMQSNPRMKYGVVTGVYNMPAFIKDGDVFGYTIFADGAGSVVLKRNEDNISTHKSRYIDGLALVDGTQWNYVGVYAGGTKKPITHDVLDHKDYGLQLLQALPGDRNLRLWPMVARELIAKTNISIHQIDHFIFTQINRSVIMDVMKALDVPQEKAVCVMDRYGYTGSGCIPMALDYAVKSKKIKKGDTVLSMASGAGLAVSANLFVY